MSRAATFIEPCLPSPTGSSSRTRRRLPRSGRPRKIGAKAMNESDRFAQADQQVSILKDRIARQREAVKQAKLRGHAVALAEAAQQALQPTLRPLAKHRQHVFAWRASDQR